jgi:hypothetical protein
VKHYFVTDVHADTSPDSAIERFVLLASWVANQNAALILGGDIFPFALESTLDAMRANANCRKVRDVLRSLGDVTLLDGNHDPYTQMSGVDRDKFVKWLGFVPVGFPSYAAIGDNSGGKIRFSHGHEYDITSKLWPVVVNVLVRGLGVARAMAFMRWFLSWWARRQNPSPTAMLARDPDAYRLMVPIIHDAAWRELLENKVGFNRAAFGHSHFDELRVKPNSGMVMANAGAFDGGGNTYALYDDRTGELTVEKF